MEKADSVEDTAEEDVTAKKEKVVSKYIKLSDFLQMFILIRRRVPESDGQLLFKLMYDLIDYMDYKRTVQIFLTFGIYEKLLEFEYRLSAKERIKEKNLLISTLFIQALLSGKKAICLHVADLFE